ncbi:DUF6262 family protein [Okeania sp. SIO2B3]|uniref:DUF6262 family protein n=1 Tax=Okeania sp. SIO2B3 TaxID=2607784 RepID=UPI0013C074F7|nr:DUF6262 family protein [Okeania sp. SIO2B3]NET44651.1 transposase [Okeania sp. SIO2B3]
MAKKKHNREKQAEVLRRTQAQRKEQKKEQVLKAIQEILAQKKSLTFANIAKVAGCSVSYLYKWDEIKVYIHELQHQENTQLNSLEEVEAKPHSLKTLHEVARQRIKNLEAEVKALKEQNELLRGHVVEIYELRDECDRLRKQLRELINSQHSSSKVIPIQTPLNDKKVSTSRPELEETPEKIIDLIQDMGLNMGTKLKKEISNRDPQKVRLAIEAFQQYQANHHINSQEACLLTMIRSEAQPNTSNEGFKPISNPRKNIVSEESNPELLTLEQLKQLSSIFDSNYEK